MQVHGRKRGWKRLEPWAAVIACSVFGCGKLTGIDQYAVGEPPLDNPCGELEVPVGDGCERVGVAECPGGFREELGGCTPILPDAPCEGGDVARAGDRECRIQAQCNEAFALPPTPLVGVLRYVAAGAPGGDGTSGEQAFASLDQALDSESGPMTILLAPGEYVGNYTLDRQVVLLGACPRDTRLIAAQADAPVISIAPGATGTRLSGFSLAGGKGGVAVNGAAVALAQLAVQQTEGPGIAFEDSGGPAKGLLEHVLVDGALGTGILAYGAALDVRSSVVRRTRPTDDGDLGRGIALFPSGFADPDLLGQGVPGVVRALAELAPSSLTLANSVVEASPDSGVWVMGSTATITESVIRSTGPQPDGQGAGVVAEHWNLGDLTANVTIDQSVIERSGDAGVRAENSCLRLTNTTIRDAGNSSTPPGADPERSCLGNGIRARHNLAVPARACADNQAPLIVRDSLIENVRESGIHVEGARAEIDHTIVRGVEPDACTGRAGDGIAGYAYDFAPASLELDALRIEKTARNAVASFGAQARMGASVLECNAGDLGLGAGLGAGEGVFAQASSLCGCRGAWRRCQVSRESGGGALRACDDANGAERCVTSCITDWLQAVAGTPNVPDRVASVWPPENADIASAVTDQDGCATYRMSAAGREYRAKFYAQGWLPAIGHVVNPPPAIPTFTEFNTLGVGLLTPFGRSLIAREPDLRNGIFLVFYVCEQGELVEGTPARMCIGRGVVGATVELTPAGGERRYVSVQGASDPNVPHITENGAVTFWDILPGRYVARVIKPEGAKGIECSPSPLGTDWQLAWRGDAPNEFRVRVEPAAVSAAYVFCVVQN